MEARHVRAAEIDWPALAHRIGTDGVETSSAAYRALAQAERILDDRDTLFVPAVSRDVEPDFGATPWSRPRTAPVVDGVALLTLEPPSGNRGTYASDVRRQLSRLTPHEVRCGLIVDLSMYPAGDLWVLLTGIAPLLGEGVVLTGHGPSGELEIAIDAGEVRVSGQPLWEHRPLEEGLPPAASGVVESIVREVDDSPSPYAPAPSDLPVGAETPIALLVSRFTGNSGVLAAIALQHRPGELRLFGQPTRGSPSGVTGYELIDGSLLRMPTRLFADRAGTKYEGELEPDASVEEHEARGVAAAWLRSAPGCDD